MNFEWHDLRLNKDDLPDKDNERTILFYVKDYPAFDKNFEFPYYHYAIVNYSLSFLEENTYLFCEHSKGYECEYLHKFGKKDATL